VETSSQEKLTPPREPDLRIEERRSIFAEVGELCKSFGCVGGGVVESCGSPVRR
jgi:hypothetical protein